MKVFYCFMKTENTPPWLKFYLVSYLMRNWKTCFNHNHSLLLLWLRSQHYIKCFYFMVEETGKRGNEIYQNFFAHRDGAGFEIPEHSEFLGTLIPRITWGPVFCSVLLLLVFTCIFILPSSAPFASVYPSVNHSPKAHVCVALLTQGCLGGVNLGEGKT